MYAIILPLIIYGLIGSSNFLSVGPVAITSLLVAATIAETNVSGTSGGAIAVGLMLALLSGSILLTMGLARLGFLINFISHPVIIGFVSAAAILIALSQLEHILGLNIPKDVSTLEILPYVVAHVNLVNITTLAIGLSSVILLLLTDKPLAAMLLSFGVAANIVTIIGKLSPILVIVLGVASVTFFSLDQTQAVAITGTIPAGLPHISVRQFDFSIVQQLIVPALVISLVGFVESTSVAKALASKRRQKVDANQELLALGMANLSASVTGAGPVTGGFSRSAVNFSAGSNSGLASIITAIFIAISLLFLTPWF
ncbi:MAG: SulP family sulfate permease [Arenicella sp.]